MKHALLLMFFLATTACSLTPINNSRRAVSSEFIIQFKKYKKSDSNQPHSYGELKDDEYKKMLSKFQCLRTLSEFKDLAKIHQLANELAVQLSISMARYFENSYGWGASIFRSGENMEIGPVYSKDGKRVTQIYFGATGSAELHGFGGEYYSEANKAYYQKLSSRRGFSINVKPDGSCHFAEESYTALLEAFIQNLKTANLK